MPTNGNSDAAVAQATIIGSSIRRRASEYVHQTSAKYMTTQEQQEQVDREVQPVVRDAEDGERAH